VGGFIGLNGLSYSDSQRMAIFSNIGRMPSLSMFAKKNVRERSPEVSSPTYYDKYDYERKLKRGDFGVKIVDRPEEVVKLPSGKEVVVSYNAVGSPYVLDSQFHDVSRAHPQIKSPALTPLNIKIEEFDPVTGKYRVIGHRDDYFVGAEFDTKAFPLHASKSGETNISGVRRFLANSEYLDKFPNLKGVEMAKDVVPLKGSEASSKDVSAAVGKFVSHIEAPKKWDMRRDELKEAKMDKKLKEAMGEKVEETIVDEPKESKTQKFVVEYEEPEGEIVKKEFIVPDMQYIPSLERWEMVEGVAPW
jgi:hypothetical protein